MFKQKTRLARNEDDEAENPAIKDDAYAEDEQENGTAIKVPQLEVAVEEVVEVAAEEIVDEEKPPQILSPRNGEENEERISYDKLKKHISELHPRDNKDRIFSMFDRISLLPVMNCWIQEPSELQKQLGMGPTLFLMSTRFMAWLFLLLTIINIPVFAYYFKGTTTDADGNQTTN
jgi:hypothetical protein